MNITKVLLMGAGVILAGGCLIGGCVFNGYNTAVSLHERVSSSWAQVENQLQRRFDLIPNLVETVKGLTAQEQQVFLGIANARKAYFQAEDRGQKIEAANRFESALSRLLVLRETYPELKSNEAFLKLQDSVEGAENRLAVERRNYNKAVESLNQFCRRFTGRFYAGLANVQPAEYFEVPDEAKAVPQVDFGGGG